MHEAFWIPADKVSGRVPGAFFEMPRKPKRVWTYLLSVDPAKPPEPDIILKHGVTAFLEDVMHDWHWTAGKFFFHPHTIPPRFEKWEDPGVWVMVGFDEES